VAGRCSDGAHLSTRALKREAAEVAGDYRKPGRSGALSWSAAGRPSRRVSGLQEHGPGALGGVHVRQHAGKEPDVVVGEVNWPPKSGSHEVCYF
jgi:hypothetical protein